MNMGIPMACFLYNESKEPPKCPLPLEARKIHFCCAPLLGSKPEPKITFVRGTDRWKIFDDDGAGFRVFREYDYRHDMIHGAFRAQTGDEVGIDWFVQSIVRKERRLEGW